MCGDSLRDSSEKKEMKERRLPLTDEGFFSVCFRIVYNQANIETSIKMAILLKIQCTELN